MLDRSRWTVAFATVLALGCGSSDGDPAAADEGGAAGSGTAGSVSGASGHAGSIAAGQAGATTAGKGGTSSGGKAGASSGAGGTSTAGKGGAPSGTGGSGGATAGPGMGGSGGDPFGMGGKASGGSGQAGKAGQGGTKSAGMGGQAGTKASGGSGQAGTGSGQAGTGTGQAGTGQGQAGSGSTSAYDCPGDAGDPFADARKECVKTINDYRATLSLPAFKRWCGNATCEDAQPKQDAAKNQAHSAFGQCMEWAQNECPGWPDAPAANIDGCLKMMWDEGPGSDFSKHGHYINMSSTKYTMVECGFAETGGGKWWGVQDFK